MFLGLSTDANENPNHIQRPRAYAIPFLTFIYSPHPSSLLLLSSSSCFRYYWLTYSLRLWLKQVIVLIIIEGVYLSTPSRQSGLVILLRRNMYVLNCFLD